MPKLKTNVSKDTMPETSLVNVNPQVMKWIIDSSGCEIEELAEKLNVHGTVIENWKIKSEGIKIAKLEKLSKYLKRPMAIFFLEKPPEQANMTDYRTIQNMQIVKLTKDTLADIRNARYLQSIAKELMQLQGLDLYPDIQPGISIRVSPEEIAKTERKKLGFESDGALLSEQAKKSARDFYSVLRESIELLNIFVFQANMPVAQVRGLTLSGQLPRVILISSKDSIKARIFSLLHEYGHVLLRKDGLCIPETTFQKSDQASQDIETWCNKFAASTLMPKTEFLEEYFKLEQDTSPERIIARLSRKFNSSKLATAIRIKSLVPDSGIVDQYLHTLDSDITSKKKKRKDELSVANQYLRTLDSDITSKKKKRKDELSVVNRCVSKKGKKFISLVLDSKSHNVINNYNIADYLDINLKHMKTLEEELS